jgi:dUTPase
MFKGNGESRKYVGSYLGKNGNSLSDFFEYSDWGKGIENGERIAQLIISRYEKIQWNAVTTLEDTARGSGGFGHTGN